jgi:hypothetical protein
MEREGDYSHHDKHRCDDANNGAAARKALAGAAVAVDHRLLLSAAVANSPLPWGIGAIVEDTIVCCQTQSIAALIGSEDPPAQGRDQGHLRNKAQQPATDQRYWATGAAAPWPVVRGAEVVVFPTSVTGLLTP